jgi:hypothetical protein
MLPPKRCSQHVAAKEGKPASGDDKGGVFTNALVTLLSNAMRIQEADVNWHSFGVALRRECKKQLDLLNERRNQRGEQLADEEQAFDHAPDIRFE